MSALSGLPSSPSPMDSSQGPLPAGRRLLASLRRHKFLGALLILLTLAAVVLTARLSVYMWSTDNRDFALIPDDDFLTRHSCLSAYAAGAALYGQRDPNLYEASHYRPETQDHGLELGALDPDPYQYPPVLLVPFQALLKLAGDLPSLRWWWYLIETAIVLAAFALVARWLGGERAYVALILAVPLVWGTMPNLLAMQFGNVQAVVLVLAVLGMIAFEKGRTSLGGALLACAILGKIFPAILVLYLLARRQWRALFATAAWGAALCLSVVVFGGWAPWLEFFTYQLPRLSSGEAFADLFIAVPISALINLSYSSLPYKLDAIGLLEAPQVSQWAAIAGNAMVALAAVVLGHFDAQRPPATAAAADGGRRLLLVLGWLSLVNLSTLQATMSPRYAVIGTLWLLTLWAAGRPAAQTTRTAFLVAGGVLLMLLAIPDPALILVSQLANIAINLAVAAHRAAAGTAAAATAKDGSLAGAAVGA